jgi:hypothetical protein
MWRFRSFDVFSSSSLGRGFSRVFSLYLGNADAGVCATARKVQRKCVCVGVFGRLINAKRVNFGQTNSVSGTR